MAFEKEFPELAEAAAAVFEMLGDLKLALSDGKISVDEIVGLVSDTGLKDSLRLGLDGLGKIPGEVEQLVRNPWNLIALTQWFTGQIHRIFK